jgi:hypothetical protein
MMQTRSGTENVTDALNPSAAERRACKMTDFYFDPIALER